MNKSLTLEEVKKILFDKERWYDSYSDAEMGIEQCYALLNPVNTNEELLNELYLLREIELSNKLSQYQKHRYLEIVEILNRNDITIPFGIEI